MLPCALPRADGGKATGFAFPGLGVACTVAAHVHHCNSLMAAPRAWPAPGFDCMVMPCGPLVRAQPPHVCATGTFWRTFCRATCVHACGEDCWVCHTSHHAVRAVPPALQIASLRTWVICAATLLRVLPQCSCSRGCTLACVSGLMCRSLRTCLPILCVPALGGLVHVIALTHAF